ncbi:MAG TPA: NTP transferase domain-containing protein [Vicinamibacterales bacterium]|nr:NTP transferase domain-containing protein [Vicinamibacterales bacterium]
MTTRHLIVAAAGLGTRLGAGRPKLLVAVGGVPMIDRLLDLFRDHIAAATIVVHPSFERDVRQHLRGSPASVTTVVQREPTGMLDAIMLAETDVRRTQPDEVWIVWCDQVAIHPATIQTLATLTAAHRDAALVLPTVRRASPYIHLQRDSRGRIVRILHRREGDTMPDVGESDMGLFAMPRASYCDLLPRFAATVSPGAATRERNFLPFIAWASREHDVVTFPSVDEMEAVGVNTPEERDLVESYLAAREGKRA